MEYITPCCNQCNKYLHPLKHIQVDDFKAKQTLEFCDWVCMILYAGTMDITNEDSSNNPDES
jgi:hypothetical protein